MAPSNPPTRWIGLDLHKQYLVATGVNADKEPVFGPFHVEFKHFPRWLKQQLTEQDTVVLEMTTNTWEVQDLLEPLRRLSGYRPGNGYSCWLVI